jgi:hypothetical protein
MGHWCIQGEGKKLSMAALRTPHTTPEGCVKLDYMKSYRQLRNFVVLERGKEENQLINLKCTN